MFVFSVKGNNIKKAVLVSILAVIIIVCACLLVRGERNKTAKTAAENSISLKASNAEERIAFLSQFGWEVSKEPAEVAEIVIPSEFDETNEEYNALQKTQGFDLSEYKGQRVKRWSYTVNNYPGYENSEAVIRANILVLDGTVIGGDVCSTELDGFMQGLYQNNVE